MAGTAMNTVGASVAMRARSRLGSNPSSSRIVPPVIRAGCVLVRIPPVKASGETMRWRSAEVSPSDSRWLTAVVQNAVCVNSAPFGRPVVPDV